MLSAIDETPHYRADIDGLRAIAVCAVVLFHAGVPGLQAGFLGVDIFFVISGYLLGGIVFREVSAGEFSFWNFYARRARRILPALIVVILATLVAGLLLLPPPELARLGSMGAYTAAALSNFRFWGVVQYFTPDAMLSPFLMTWSLGVEEQFYVIFPVLVLLAFRFARSWLLRLLILATVASFVLSVILTPIDQQAAFFLLPTRGWQLGAGAILAIGANRLQIGKRLNLLLSVSGLIGLGFSLTVFDDPLLLPGWRAALPVAATLAVIAAEKSWLNKVIIGCEPMRWIGLISYSLYLWHWPMLAYLRIATHGDPRPAAIATTVVASVLAAFASWQFIERPFRRRLLASKSIVVRYIVIMFIVAALSAAIRLSDGLPSRYGGSVQGIREETKGGICTAYPGQTMPSRAPECAAPRTSNVPVVALIGDSHAGSLAPGLNDVAREYGWQTDTMAKAGCRPVTGVPLQIDDPLLGPNAASECEAFNANVFKLIAHDQSVKVVLLAGIWAASIHDGDDRELRIGLAETVKSLRSAGKRVFLVEDVPSWTADPVHYVATRALPARQWLAGLSGPTAIPRVDWRITKAGDAILTAVARETGTKVLSSRVAMCRSECSFERRGEMLYADSHHISAAGARAIAPLFAEDLFTTR